MSKPLEGKKVAILASDGFEQVELMDPRKMLEDAGAKITVISPNEREIRGWKVNDWGEPLRIDLTLSKAKVADYDALVLPGGVINPDQMRMDAKAVGFVKEFVESGKLVAAICHGPWMLVEADVVRGKRLTSWPSLKTDLRNAGANWVDEAAVVDGNLITSRSPKDIPAFGRTIIEQLAAVLPLKAAS